MEVAGGEVMPGTTVFAVYASAAIIALALLHFFRAAHWYWHALSVLVALAIGLIPLPAAWQKPHIDLAIGGVFLFFLVWGVCAPLFPDHHDHHHPRPHHA